MTVPGGRMAALQPSPSTAHAVPLPLASRGRQERNADFTLIAEGDTTPSEPSEPSEPFEPGPQSGPMGDTTTLSAKGAVKPKNPPAHWAGQT